MCGARCTGIPNGLQADLEKNLVSLGHSSLALSYLMGRLVTLVRVLSKVFCKNSMRFSGQKNHVCLL